MIKGVFKESLVSIIIDAIESFFRRLLTKIQSLAKTCLKRRQTKWRVGYHSRKVARMLPMMATLSTFLNFFMYQKFSYILMCLVKNVFAVFGIL